MTDSFFPSQLDLATSDGHVVCATGVAGSNATYQDISPNLGQRGAVGTAIKLLADPHDPNRLLLFGSCGIAICDNAAVSTPVWNYVPLAPAVTFDFAQNDGGFYLQPVYWSSATLGTYVPGTGWVSQAGAGWQLVISKAIQIPSLVAAQVVLDVLPGGSNVNLLRKRPYWWALDPYGYGDEITYTISSTMTTRTMNWNIIQGINLDMGFQSATQWTLKQLRLLTSVGIGDMTGSTSRRGYFGWLTKRTLDSVDYVYYNYTSDFFSTIDSIQVAHYSTGIVYSIATAPSSGTIWVTAGSPTGNSPDAGVYESVDWGQTFRKLEAPTIGAGGGVIHMPLSLPHGRADATSRNLITLKSVENNDLHTLGFANEPATVSGVGGPLSSQALTSFVYGGAYLNALGQSGSAGTLLTSDDGGDSWTSHALGSGREGYALSGWSSSRDCLIVGGTNTLAYTMDRGTNWTDLWSTFASWANTHYGTNQLKIVTAQVGLPSAPTHDGPGFCPICFLDKIAAFLFGNPVSAQNGEKYEENTDLQLATPAGALTLTRTYRQNKQTSNQLMGLGWTHNHAIALTKITETPARIIIRMPNAGEAHFTETTTDHYAGDPGSASFIDWESDTSRYTLTAADQSTYVFDGDGKLLSHAWPNGESWMYSYTDGKLIRVDDGYGRQLNFTYRDDPGQSDDGQLWRVGDQNATGLDGSNPTGVYVELGYTPQKNGGVLRSNAKALLASVRDVRGLTWTYDYYGQHSGETAANQLDFLTQRQSPEVDTTGEGTPDTPIILERLDYTLSGSTITGIIQQRGIQGNTPARLETTLAFQPDGQPITTATIGGKTTTHHFANGLYLGAEDPAGNRTLQTPNYQYRPEFQKDANGNQVLLQWSVDGKQLQQAADALGQRTAFTYNTTGASVDTLDSSLDAEGRRTQYTYGDTNNPRLPTQVKVLDTDGTTVLRWQKFTYDSSGHTLTEQTVDPATGTAVQHQVTRTYYTSGNGDGLLHTVTQEDLLNSANNITTTYFYDSAGRVVQMNQTATFGSCTRSYTVYDAAGNVVASICNYDPGSSSAPTTVAEAIALYNPSDPNNNHVTVHAYDALGRRIQTTTNAGSTTDAQTTVTVYDGLNRVVRTITNYVASSAIADPYVHDRSAFDHGARNDQNLVTDTAYNERGLVRSQTDVLGKVTLFGYDDAGRLIKTIQSASQPDYDNSYGTGGDPELTNYVPDSAADEDIITTNQYDPAGNLVKTVDALGNVSFTVYDALNRPIKTVRSAKDTATVALNVGDSGYAAENDPRSDSYVASADPNRDLIDWTEYDTMGRAQRSQDVLGNWTLFGYDALGRQVKVIRRASVPDYDSTADPDLSGYTPGTDPDQDLITETAYDSQGRVLYTTDVQGQRTWSAYDGLGRTIKTIVNAVGTATDGGVTDPRSDTYVPSSDPDKDLITRTAYDRDGQVLYTTDIQGQRTWSAYDSLGRVIKIIVNAVGTAMDGGVNDPRSDSYVASTDPDKDRITRTHYRPDGRVDWTQDPVGRKTWSVYDRLGRVIKTIANCTYVSGSPAPEDDTYSGSSDPDQDLITRSTYDVAGRVLTTTDAVGNQTQYEYDALGRRTKTTANAVDGVYDSAHPDEDLIQTIAYDKGGRVISTVDVRGTTTNLVYDAVGRQREIIQAAGTPLATTSYTCYDKGSRVLRVITNWVDDPNQPSPDARDTQGNWLFVPSLYGRLQDENRVTAYTLDRLGRPLEVTDPVGNTTSTAYTGSGQVQSVTDAEGVVSQYRYDLAGRRTLVVQGYQANGEDPALWVWSASNQRWQKSGGAAIDHGSANDRNVIVQATYDKPGRLVSQRDPRGKLIQYTYDLLGRRTGLTDPFSHTWATSYATLTGGQARVTVTDPLSYQTRQDFDLAGRLATLQYLNETPTRLTPDVTFTYDKLGNRTLMSESDGVNMVRRTLYGYDQARRLTSVGFDRDGNGTVDQSVTYQYDAGGLRTQLTLPGSLTVVYTYNTRGQLVSLTDWSSQTTRYAFDRAGRLIAQERANGLRSAYTYDAGGRLRQLRHTAGSQTLGHFTYTVDRRGNRIQALEVLPRVETGVTTLLSSDAAVDYYQGTWTSSGAFKVSSNISAALRLLFFSNQATLTMGVGPDHSIYDVYVNFALWRSFDGYAAAAGEQAIAMTLDGEGPWVLEVRNRAEKNRASSGYTVRFKSLVTATGPAYDAQTITYGYDALARLVQADYYPGLNTGAAASRQYVYAYDLAGNRTQQTVTLGGTPTVTSYTYDASNRLVGDGTHTFTYDDAGRMTSDGVNTYAWDRANRLLSMGGNAYQYNGLGQRVQQTVGAQVTQYLLDVQPGLWQVLAATQGTNTTRYVHGPAGLLEQQNPDDAWRWPVVDGLGSVRRVVNNSLAPQESRLHSPFGEQYGQTLASGETPSVFGFTGQETDGNGLVNLRARYYNPTLGVFTGLDPLEGQMAQPMSLNRYMYVQGSVVNRIDPSTRGPKRTES